MNVSLDHAVSQALAEALADFLAQRIDRAGLARKLRAALTLLEPKEAAGAAPAPELPFVRPEQRVEDELRARAFGRGFDTRTVGRIFSEERDRAGRGKYALRLSDHDAADAALRWALAESESEPEVPTRESARAYFTQGGEWERGAGFPFKGWAADPGKWLALSRRERPVGRGAGILVVDDPAKETERVPPEQVREYVGEIMANLARRGGS